MKIKAEIHGGRVSFLIEKTDTNSWYAGQIACSMLLPVDEWRVLAAAVEAALSAGAEKPAVIVNQSAG